MNKLIFFKIVCLIIISQFAYAQTDFGKVLERKLDKAVMSVDKEQNTSKVWEQTVDIANMIKQHPEYDDGEFAEAMISLVTMLLMKPWQYASPYLTGDLSTPYFRDFVIQHVNELASPQDLKVMKKNISTHCDQVKYPYCKQLIIKIDQSMQ